MQHPEGDATEVIDGTAQRDLNARADAAEGRDAGRMRESNKAAGPCPPAAAPCPTTRRYRRSPWVGRAGHPLRQEPTPIVSPGHTRALQRAWLAALSRGGSQRPAGAVHA